MRHIFQVIKIHACIGNFKAIAHVAVADEGVGGRIEHDRAINNHPVVVVAGGLGLAGVGPHAVGAFGHVEGRVVNRNLDLLCVGSFKLEGNPQVGFNARELDSRNVER